MKGAAGLPNDLAAVVIGRNEGERLRVCLTSVVPRVATAIYVDSGSTDGSPELAVALGARVVKLDLRRPFTAARARNAGLSELCRVAPQTRLVQFVDGDCEIAAGWFPSALDFLDAHADIAVLCGRLRERHPERSVYNELCDIEWDGPVGEVGACGGVAMARVAALRQVGGYRDSLIAGEEPELCVRLRAAGSKVWRTESEMAMHDAAMTSFRQWWWRTLRTGYGFAQTAHLHGASPARHNVREMRRAWAWGIALPVAVAFGAGMWGPWAFAALAAYPLQVLRLYFREQGTSRRRALRSVFLVMGRFAEGVGVIKYLVHRWTGRAPQLIEYK